MWPCQLMNAPLFGNDADRWHLPSVQPISSENTKADRVVNVFVVYSEIHVQYKHCPIALIHTFS